jgi:hypothetical protein
MALGNVALGGVAKGKIGTPGCMHPDALRAALGRESKHDEAAKKLAASLRVEAVEAGASD